LQAALDGTEDMRRTGRLLVIGLDSAPPALVFDRWADDLPTLSRLRRTGVWGPLESTHPPITIPAWTSMLSGRDPGELGLYGFRNRASHDYGAYALATGADVRVDRVWDILGREGFRSVLLGVPQTFPPRPLHGEMISCFLTPSLESPFTYPPALAEEVRRVVREYLFDVEGFRTSDKVGLLERVYDKTRKHLALARHLVATRPWDFFMLVEMGVDRIQHGFWRFMDPAHRRYESGNPFEEAIRDYYRYLDGEVASLLDLVPDDTTVLVVSDHGAKKMEGGICINEWLIREGYLVLREHPAVPTRLEGLAIDWARTTAWADGGYYGRVFLNARGREPEGRIAPGEFERVRDEIAVGLGAIPDPTGAPLPTRVHRPEELYRDVRGVAPDLLVYFGDLAWRSVGSVGTGRLHVEENDTGPDDSNHDWHGSFLLARPDRDLGGAMLGVRPLYDVAPTILSHFGVAACGGTLGRSLAPA
jgi:predicted AlkP superfamily phosphohydrolase/phosphomutase